MAVIFPLEPKKTALLIYDVVNEMADPGGAFYDPSVNEILSQIQKLLGVCRARGIAVFYTVPANKGREDMGRMADFYPELVSRGLFRPGSHGSQVHSSIKPEAGDRIIEKPRYGAFHGTRLDQVLRRKGIDTILICGISTQVGCSTTAREAASRDFKVVMVRDACLSRPIADQGWGPVNQKDVERVHMSTLSRSFAMVASTDEVTRRLR
ncbi:MAG: isochorismatase family cysteine hydrolase [Dehalococcoidia bacterium]|nr:isochorismatase family cysteine hydrolase [Dehalococcoidia bacterium]